MSQESSSPPIVHFALTERGLEWEAPLGISPGQGGEARKLTERGISHELRRCAHELRQGMLPTVTSPPLPGHTTTSMQTQGGYDQGCPESADSGPAIEFPNEARTR